MTGTDLRVLISQLLLKYVIHINMCHFYSLLLQRINVIIEVSMQRQNQRTIDLTTFLPNLI